MTLFSDPVIVDAPITPDGSVPNWAGATLTVICRVVGGVNGWCAGLRSQLFSDGSSATTNNGRAAVEARSTVSGTGETARGVNAQAFSVDPNPDEGKTVVGLEANSGAVNNVGERFGGSAAPTLGSGVGIRRDAGWIVQSKAGVPPFRKGFWVDQDGVAEYAFLSTGYSVDPFGSLQARGLRLESPPTVTGSCTDGSALRNLLEIMARQGWIINSTVG